MRISLRVFTEYKVSHFLLSLLLFWKVVSVLDEEQSYDLLPVVIENLFAKLMCSNTVGSKSLHTKIVNEAGLLNIFDVFGNLLLCDGVINESKSN